MVFLGVSAPQRLKKRSVQDLERQDFFWCLATLKLDVAYDAAPVLLGYPGSSRVFWAHVQHCFELIGTVVNEIHLSDLYDPWNHTPHYPHYITFSVDTVPIPVLGGESSKCPSVGFLPSLLHAILPTLSDIARFPIDSLLRLGFHALSPPWFSSVQRGLFLAFGLNKISLSSPF